MKDDGTGAPFLSSDEGGRNDPRELKHYIEIYWWPFFSALKGWHGQAARWLFVRVCMWLEAAIVSRHAHHAAPGRHHRRASFWSAVWRRSSSAAKLETDVGFVREMLDARLGAVIQVANRIERMRRMENILEWALMGAITEDVAEAVVEYEDRGRSAEELMIIVGDATRAHSELLAKFRRLPLAAQDAITAHARPFPTAGAARGGGVGRRGREEDPGGGWRSENGGGGGGQDGRVWVYPRPPPDSEQMGEAVAKAAGLAARCNSLSSLEDFQAALEAAQGATEHDEEAAGGGALASPGRIAPGRPSLPHSDAEDNDSNDTAPAGGASGQRAPNGERSSLGTSFASTGRAGSRHNLASSNSGRLAVGTRWRVRAIGGVHRVALTVQEKVAHSVLRVGRWVAVASGGGAQSMTSVRRGSVTGTGGGRGRDRIADATAKERQRSAMVTRTASNLQSLQVDPHNKQPPARPRRASLPQGLGM